MTIFLWPVLALAMLAADQPRRAEPLASPASWFSDADYPLEALRRGAEGQVRFRLQIEATGRPIHCEIEESSGDAALDATTCEVALARFRFRPAQDARGDAVPDTYASRINWRLSRNQTGMEFVPYELATTLRAEAGELSCVMAASGGPERAGPVEACGFLTGSGADVALRRSGVEAEVTLVFWLLPEGEQLPGTSGRDRGDVLGRIEVEFVLAPDGSFSECRIVSRMLQTAGEAVTDLPDPCSMHAPGRAGLFVPTENEEAPRSGRIGFTLHVRQRVPL
jgi:TonB family protein